jgi:hypothetical protein
MRLQPDDGRSDRKRILRGPLETRAHLFRARRAVSRADQSGLFFGAEVLAGRA